MTSRFEAHYADSRFVVERDDAVGWYLYVYHGDRCTHDYLQDTLELALEHAERQFGVPRSAWQPPPT